MVLRRWWKGGCGSVLYSVVALTLISCGGGGSPSQPAPPPPVNVPLTLLSTDTFTNNSSQHATEVEAHALGVGSTIVSTFQVGRIFGGGGADIGFATTTDGGANWTSGFLPGLTVFEGSGLFTAASDPVVAYDAAHVVWLINTLPIGTSAEVAVSRSSDGLNWGNPIIVSTTTDSDKNWIVCDNTASSPFYGHCYVEWDDPSAGAGLVWMRTSTDGGLTWGAPLNSADLVRGIGGVPVVQPDGTVVVPIEAWDGMHMLAFTSIDGGSTWKASTVISKISDHTAAGSLRTSALPSAAADANGTVYVVWQDCRFRSNCASNDIVLSTSTDGLSWTMPVRIPIDATSSSVDHFIPGLAVDPASSSPAHLGLTYYFYPTANCSGSSCNLMAGFISSPDGGLSWSNAMPIAGPMALDSLPNTFAGLMVGDYVATGFSGGKAFSVFAVAHNKSGVVFNEPMYTVTGGVSLAENGVAFASFAEQPVPHAHSDHPPRQFYDQEHRFPIPPQD